LSAAFPNPKGTVPVVSPNPPFVTIGTVPFLPPRFSMGRAKAQALALMP